jgi:hypothetical protein
LAIVLSLTGFGVPDRASADDVAVIAGLDGGTTGSLSVALALALTRGPLIELPVEFEGTVCALSCVCTGWVADGVVGTDGRGTTCSPVVGLTGEGCLAIDAWPPRCGGLDKFGSMPSLKIPAKFYRHATLPAFGLTDPEWDPDALTLRCEPFLHSDPALNTGLIRRWQQHLDLFKARQKRWPHLHALNNESRSISVLSGCPGHAAVGTAANRGAQRVIEFVRVALQDALKTGSLGGRKQIKIGLKGTRRCPRRAACRRPGGPRLIPNRPWHHHLAPSGVA